MFLFFLLGSAHYLHNRMILLMFVLFFLFFLCRKMPRSGNSKERASSAIHAVPTWYAMRITVNDLWPQWLLQNHRRLWWTTHVLKSIVHPTIHTLKKIINFMQRSVPCLLDFSCKSRLYVNCAWTPSKKCALSGIHWLFLSRHGSSISSAL